MICIYVMIIYLFFIMSEVIVYIVSLKFIAIISLVPLTSDKI